MALKDAKIVASPVSRDDLGAAALARAGFERQALNQLLMTRSRQPNR